MARSAAVALLEHALAIDKVILPPRAVEAVEPHSAAAVWCVHEALLADVNTDMTDRMAGSEEHQITRLELSTRQLTTSNFTHDGRLARQSHLSRIAKDVSHQPAAIKSTGWRVAAPMIRRANQ